MDDRDLPRKMLDGKRVKAYYSYEVLSGCVNGSAYTRNKDKRLFIDWRRDMFRFLSGNSLGIPLEVEVEHHLVNNYRNDLMSAGIVFPFVRWANAGNAQEKHAENFNKAKKYGFEKRYQDGIGRFYAKLDANRTHQDKIFDGENCNYKDKLYSFEQLVEDDLFIIRMCNNSPHPNQKKYKGMTRMEVLLENPNPELAKYEPSLLARYIGEKRKTSIVRSQYVKVQYGKYQLPSVSELEKLEPNNYGVTAYWLPDGNGEIKAVYLYQGDRFICECQKIRTFNTARAEWTEDDKEAYTNQMKYISNFDKTVKDDKGELAKVELIKHQTNKDFKDIEPEIVHEVVMEDVDENDEFERLLKDKEILESYKKRAYSEL